ncbi:translation elongation factor Ts [Anaerolineales bacterium]
MAITAQQVKELREMTGAGPKACKDALVEMDGNVEKAAEKLREKGLAKAVKTLGKGRVMNEGLVEIYQHFNKRMAVIVEVNCETDFVAKTDSFQQFAKDVAMHIATMKPLFVKREDVPADLVAKEQEMQLRITLEEGKPENIADKIVAGRMDKWYSEIVLMEQEFIKDDSKTIGNILTSRVAELGESIEIRRFQRFEIGESLDSAETDETAE